MSSYRSRLPSSCTMRTGGILAGASAVTGGILAGASAVTGGFGSGASAVRVSSICLTGINGFILVFCRSAGGGCSARASMMAGLGTSMRSSPGTRWIANTISSVVIAVKTAITLSGVILIGILKLPCGSHSGQRQDYLAGASALPPAYYRHHTGQRRHGCLAIVEADGPRLD